MKKTVLLILALTLTGVVFAEATLKFVTINVWSGLTHEGALRSGVYESEDERAFRYGLLVNGLRELDADVISVNEANMLPGYAKRLARDLDYDYVYAVRYAGVRVGQVGFPVNVREGEVLLAKRHLNLAHVGSRKLTGGYAGNLASFHFGDTARILAGKITVGERDVYIFTTRWSASEFASDLQLRNLVDLFSAGHVDGEELLVRMADAVSGYETRLVEAARTVGYIDEMAGDAPVVLMGTLNSLPDSPEMHVLYESDLADAWSAGLGAGYTWDAARNTNIIDYHFDEGSHEPPRRDRIDYILHSSEGILARSAAIALDDATYKTHPSDHFALIAELDF
jgi:hypothetical protein